MSIPHSRGDIVAHENSTKHKKNKERLLNQQNRAARQEKITKARAERNPDAPESTEPGPFNNPHLSKRKHDIDQSKNPGISMKDFEYENEMQSGRGFQGHGADSDDEFGAVRRLRILSVLSGDLISILRAVKSALSIRCQASRNLKNLSVSSCQSATKRSGKMPRRIIQLLSSLQPTQPKRKRGQMSQKIVAKLECGPL